MGFIDKITTCSRKADSLVCVGLDTDPHKIPAHLGCSSSGLIHILHFNKMIINATSDLVCAYKPNAAFYEAMGSSGIDLLEKTCSAIHASHDDIPVILDVKRGDIGNSAARYATAAYDIFGADAVTVNPYMGFDAVRPFLREDKAVFVLCVTSNPSAEDFQFLQMSIENKNNDKKYCALYEHVARKAVSWSKEGEIGLVMGATRPEVMRKIRDIVGDMPILVPGVGAQGGDLESVIAALSPGLTGGSGGSYGRTIINSSRGILYASQGHDFAEAARANLVELRNEINRYRRAID